MVSSIVLGEEWAGSVVGKHGVFTEVEVRSRGTPKPQWTNGLRFYDEDTYGTCVVHSNKLVVLA